MFDFKEFQLLHTKSSNFYASFDTGFIVTGIVLASVSTVLSSILSGGGLQDSRTSVYVGIAFFSGLHGVMTAVQKALGFIKIAEQHKALATQYGLLWTKIDVQLALPPNLRCNPERFIKRIENDRANLIRNSEAIPGFIESKYRMKRAILAASSPAHVSPASPEGPARAPEDVVKEEMRELEEEVQVYIDSEIQKQYNERMKKLASRSDLSLKSEGEGS